MVCAGTTCRSAGSIGWQGAVSSFVVLCQLVLVAGCTFDATVGEGSCAEGARSEGRVCRDGDWVVPETGEHGTDTRDGVVDADAGAGTIDAAQKDVCRTESCGDGNAGCTPGAERPCYEGPSGTAGVGICEKGRSICQQDGVWGPCREQTTPEDEVCGDGEDNNCSGTADEGCGPERCNFDGRTSGVCADLELEDGDCPRPEAFEDSEVTCDGQRDNDCDGRPDASDPDCNRPPGDSCTSSRQCRGHCAPVEGDDNPGVCAHRVFVTSTETPGNLGGLSGADQRCARLARMAGLKGTWRAILSDAGDSAQERIDLTAPLYTLAPTGGAPSLVADSEGDLWDESIESPIDVTEKGGTRDTAVWSGTNRDGTRDGNGEFGNGDHCGNWTTDSDRVVAEAGRSTATGPSWIIETRGLGDRPCDDPAGLYCVDGQ